MYGSKSPSAAHRIGPCFFLSSRVTSQILVCFPFARYLAHLVRSLDHAGPHPYDWVGILGYKYATCRACRSTETKTSRKKPPPAPTFRCFIIACATDVYICAYYSSVCLCARATTLSLDETRKNSREYIHREMVRVSFGDMRCYCYRLVRG